jgi:hypothetical protein
MFNFFSFRNKLNFFLNPKFLFSLFFIFSIFFFLLNRAIYFNLNYLIFSFISFYVVYELIFFSKLSSQKFIGLFLFLGFWLKLTYNLYFDNPFPEALNYTDEYKSISSQFVEDLQLNNTKSKTIYNASSIFLLSVILSKKLFYNNFFLKDIKWSKIKYFAELIFLNKFVLFLLFILFFWNAFLQINVRGFSPQINSYLIISLFKFFFNFLILIFLAIMLDIYIQSKSNFNYFFFIILVLNFSFILQLSRIQILFLLPIFYAIYKYFFFKKYKNLTKKKVLILYSISLAVTIASFFIVYFIRQYLFLAITPDQIVNLPNVSSVQNIFFNQFFNPFLINRWVGLDSLVSVVYSFNLDSFTFNLNNFNFILERGIILSDNNNNKIYNFILGPCAFFFKSGSLIFLFISNFLFCTFIFFIDNFFTKNSKNFFFNTFLGLILSFQYTHVGSGGLNTIYFYLSIFLILLLLFKKIDILKVINKVIN